MASLSLFVLNLKQICLQITKLLQLKIPKAHGKNYIKVVQLVVRHLLHNLLLHNMIMWSCSRFRRFKKEALWPLGLLDNFFVQRTKIKETSDCDSALKVSFYEKPSLGLI